MSDSQLEKLIFLDIDGVVHKLNSGTHMHWEQCMKDPTFFLPELVARVLAIVGATGAGIVISSAWRRDFRVDQFNEVFDGKVVGVNGHFGGDFKEYKKGQIRYKECLTYIASNKLPTARWIAIDDQPKHYPGRNNIFITDASIGITEAIQDDCIRYLNR
ncbi:HAD domain-containing protein [Simiduia curdlanivorans]|uniref:HAD domain-containing protein n=1 Tax=Simiduia curdlanivorans TaxID=1492769 RepID=A0ABV8UZP6_9GAMM|nr:HAD domain-containing protein [Simiduia curdlanivorans]MDN3639154.1 HAD domain-containing protein [Simiduia curdlanivorans]